MFKETNNKVAKILKIYAILNVIGGIIISRVLAWNLPMSIADGIAWGFLAAVIVISFMIYAFGEVVDLLAQIRDNTKPDIKKSEPSFEDQLPDL